MEMRWVQPLILLFILCLVFLSETGSAKNIFVLGGNGLLGAAAMDRLIAKGHNIMIVNRGTWYWDTDQFIKPFVKLIKCDRRKSIATCGDMDFLLNGEKKDVLFDAVIDFSSFRGEGVEDVLQVLRGRIKRYIFISSDSVYEVCMKNHSDFSLETDAVRPLPEAEMLLYSQKDMYGNRKKEGEEVLERQVEGGVPFVALRLPDVIGPRDNTFRWWIYQLWIKLSEFLDRPLTVPKAIKDKPLSFVYSYDVADLIVTLLDSDLKIYNQAYNLAFDENPTLRDVLEIMASQLDLPNTQINVNENPEMTYLWPSEPSQQQYDISELSSADNGWLSSIYLFPSVSLGAINTNKAKKFLNWKPTPFSEASKESVKFFEEAMVDGRYESERQEVIRSLLAHFSLNRDRAKKGIEQVYGYTSKGVHTEL